MFIYTTYLSGLDASDVPVGETSRSRCFLLASSAKTARYRRAVRLHHPCRSGSPDPDLFGIGRSRTTEVGLARWPVSRVAVAWRGTGPRPTVRGAVPDTAARGPVPRERFRPRSAWASAPRVRSGFLAIGAWRGTGPRPTGRAAVPGTVARGPVPRERFMPRRAWASAPRLRAGFLAIGAWRGTGPRPT